MTDSIRKRAIDQIIEAYGGDSVALQPIFTDYELLKSQNLQTLTGIWTPETDDTNKQHFGAYSATAAVRVERIVALEFDNLTWIERSIARRNAAEATLSELQGVLACIDPELGGLVEMVDYAGGNILIPGEQQNSIGAFIVIRIRYSFSLSDPTVN